VKPNRSQGVVRVPIVAFAAQAAACAGVALMARVPADARTAPARIPLVEIRLIVVRF